MKNNTWLEQYAAQLAEIDRSRGAALRGGTSKDAINRLLAARVADANKPDFEAVARQSSKGGFGIGDAWGAAKSGGGRILDVLSRGVYASANATRAAQKAGVVNKSFWKPGLIEAAEQGKLDDIVGAWGRGFSGKDKTTYSDVLRDSGVKNKWALGIGGFAGDVFLDPTTYIGGGAVGSVVRGGFKLAGKTPPKFGRAKNTLGTEKVLLPEEKAAEEIITGGTTVVKESNTEKILKALNPPKGQIDEPFNVVEDIVPESRQIARPPATTFAVDSKGVATYKPWNRNTRRLAAESTLRSLQSQRARLLSGIETKRYGKNIKIDPLYKTIKQPVTEKYLEDVAEELPRKPLDQGIKERVIKLSSVAQGQNQTIKLFDKNGKALRGDDIAVKSQPTEAQWAKLPESEQMRLANLSPEDQVTAFRALMGKSQHQIKGVGTITLKSLHKIIKEGSELPEVIKGAHIRIGNKYIPLDKAIKSIRDDIEADDTVAKTVFDEKYTVTKQIEKERVVEKAIEQRLSPSETMAWAIKYKDILDPEDMLALRRAVGLGSKATNTVMQRILNKTVPRDFKDIADLRAARDAKMLTAKGMATLKYRMSEAGIRNLPDIDKRIEKAMIAVREAIGNPTPANKAKAQKAVDAVDKTAASKTVSKGQDAVDDIWSSPAVVEQVATKIEKAAKGEVEDFAKPRVSLAPQQAQIVTEAVRKLNQSEFVDAANKEIYGFQSNTGAKRTHKTPGVGRGRYQRGVNKFSQMNLGKEIISGASKLVRGTPKEMRPAAMYDTTMPMLLAAEQTMRQAGIPLILGKGATGLPMSIHDVLSALPRAFVEKYYFTPQRSLGITQLADISEQFIRHNLGQLDAASVRENIKALLVQPMGRAKLESPLTKSLGGKVDQTADEFMQVFMEAAPKLNEALTTNSAAALIKVGDEAKALTDEVITVFNALVTDPRYSAADVMEAALNISKTVNEAAATRAIPVSSEARALAEQAVSAHAAETLPMAVVATHAKAARKYKAANTTSARAKVSEQLAKSADVEASTIMREEEISTFDLGVLAEFGLGVGTFRAFAPHLGNETIRPVLTERMSVAQSLSKQFTVQLGKLNAMHTKEDLVEAFARLQQGQEAATPAMQAIEQTMKELFNINGSEYGLLARNGISRNHLHSKFKHFGIGDQYRLGANMDESWRDWKLDDPLDFMSKFHAAVTSAVTERQVGADISRLFGRSTPINDGQRWVQIRDPQGKSKLASLIDKEKFYPEDIARQMHMIDKTMKELEKPIANNVLLRTLDSAMHSYKAGMTIYRPGHHARNLVGNIWLSSMDGVTPPYYKRSTAVLGTRKSQYTDFDAIRALQDAYRVEGIAPKSVLNLVYNGKKISISPDEAYRMAFDSSVLPDYSVLEDIAFGATQQADRVAETLKKVSPLRVIPLAKPGSIHKAASKTSEYSDHYVRIAHWLYAMEKNGPLKGATLEEALKNASHMAGRRVRKWHPDGSDLSQFERSTMRRTILFYSWIRKAIPLVIEATVTKPGRVMVFPKAMQNIAAANGIDLEGYGNPFPADQLFPSYIADSTQGPQWGQAGQYAGLKPGIPNMDVMDDFAAGPAQTLRTVVGGINPLLKIPFEAATGDQARTGTPIMDTSDYIDSQIPGGNYISKAAGGRSLSSGFTQPTRVAPSNMGYEGNPNLPGNGKGLTDFLNWLLGMGVTNYSKPSTIISAQRERSGR